MRRNNEKPIVRFFVPDGEGGYVNMDDLPKEEREAISDRLGERMAEALQNAYASKLMR